MEIAWLKAGQHPQFLATFQGHLITSESLHLRTSSVIILKSGVQVEMKPGTPIER